MEKDLVEYINEGCDLLNQYRQPQDSVAALNFTNPFSFGLKMKPSRGGTTWLQYGNNFDEAGPSPERIFGDASLVMLPKLFSDKTLVGPCLESMAHSARALHFGRRIAELAVISAKRQRDTSAGISPRR